MVTYSRCVWHLVCVSSLGRECYLWTWWLRCKWWCYGQVCEECAGLQCLHLPGSENYPSPLLLPCGQPSWNKTTKQSELTTKPCMQQVPRPSVWLVIVGGCNPDWSPSLPPSHLSGGRHWERLRSGTTSSHPGQLDARLGQLNTSPLKHNL